MIDNGPDLWALYLAVFTSALAVVLLATPWAMSAARRLGVLDVPSARKVHLQPTPLLGGVAIYAAIWIALLLISRLGLARQYVFLPDTTGELALIFLSTVVLILVGILDDHATGGIPPWAKLLGQFLAAAIVLAAGVRFHVFGLLPLDLVLTLVWLVGISNAVNFLDNIDGLSAGVNGYRSRVLFPIGVGKRTVSRRDHGPGGGGRLPRLPALQFQPRRDLHGRRRHALPRLPPRYHRCQATTGADRLVGTCSQPSSSSFCRSSTQRSSP